jgi:tetraacyldisaccharide 4'-kinase
LLRPFSWIFAGLTGLRRALYRNGILARKRAGVPVIVVGNITVGGTGKTPLVLALAESLKRSGFHCGIVTRGYTRRKAEVAGDKRIAEEFLIRMVPATLPPNEVACVGDEAALLAIRSGLPVVQSANRVAAARTLLRDYPDVNVIISDDGLQHYALHRDIEICVVDGERGVGNGALLPAGPLREPIARLRQVDAMVVNGASESFDVTRSGASLVNDVFSMSLGNETLIRVRDGKSMTIDEGIVAFAGKKILAVAGTGNPLRFFSHLARLGFAPANTEAFADHHPFEASDFTARNADVILMTEKDAVKCRAFADVRMWFMRVDALLPRAFDEFVLKRLSELRK